MRRLVLVLVLLLTTVAGATSYKKEAAGNRQFPGALWAGPVTSAQLATTVLPNGFAEYCSDCTASAACLSGGAGTMAYRLGGSWQCNLLGGGGGGSPPGGASGNLQTNNGSGGFGAYAGSATCTGANAIQQLSASGVATCVSTGASAPAFTAITSGVNTVATMTVGAGALMTTTGTGSIVATDLRSVGSVVNIGAAASPLAGQVLTASGGTAASWQTPAGTGTVTHTVGPLSTSALVIGNAAADVKVLGTNCGGNGTGACGALDSLGNLSVNTVTTNDQNPANENGWSVQGNQGMAAAPACAGRLAKVLTLIDTSNQATDTARTYHFCFANVDGPTIPVSNDFLVTKSSTDTLTNKTYDTAGTGNVFKVGGTQVTGLSGTNAPPKTLGTTTGTFTANDCVKADANGNLVDAGAACGGGAVANSLNLMLPMGLNGGPAPLNSSTQTLIMVANTLYCYPFVPSITLQNATRLAWYVNTGQTSAHCSVGIWNDAGTTLLMNSGTQACAVSGALFTITGLTATTLSAGTRYQACFTTDQTNLAIEGFGGGSGQGVLVLNAFVPRQGQRASATSGGSQPASTGAMVSGQYPLPYLLISTE